MLARAPDFAIAHEVFAGVLLRERPASSNSDLRRAETVREAEEHLKAFREACPESLRGAGWYPLIQDRAFMKATLTGLESIARRPGEKRIWAVYPHIWKLREKTWESTAEGYKALVRRDVLAIRVLNRPHDREWLRALAAGYRLTGDEEHRIRLEEQVLKAAPHSQQAYEITRRRWDAETVEQRKRSNRGGQPPSSETLQQWRLQWPNLPQVIFDSWDGMRRSNDPGILGFADTFLAVAGQFPDILFPIPPVLQVAAEYTRAGVDQHRIADLLREGWRQAQEQESYRQQSEYPELRMQAERRLKEVQLMLRKLGDVAP